MFGRPGTAYVYPIHTRHCFNIATEAVDTGAAVLIRALQPVVGRVAMADRRGLPSCDSPHDRKLTSGPGMICQALAIDRGTDGSDVVTAADIAVTGNDPAPARVRTTSRIGISRAVRHRWRYVAAGHRHVSGRAADHVRDGEPRWVWRFSDDGSAVTDRL